MSDPRWNEKVNKFEMTFLAVGFFNGLAVGLLIWGLWP